MNPEIPVPRLIKDELSKALQTDQTYYVGSRGDQELLEALSADFAANFQLTYSPQQFVICAGTQLMQSDCH